MNSPQSIFIEAAALVTGATVAVGKQIVAAIDQGTMDQLRGSDGALIGAVIIVGALWTMKIYDGRRLDKRHDEAIKIQKDNAKQLLALTAESIKAHGLSVGAIKSMDRTIQHLSNEMSEWVGPMTKR